MVTHCSTHVSTSRSTPLTCGAQRIEYWSCTWRSSSTKPAPFSAPRDNIVGVQRQLATRPAARGCCARCATMPGWGLAGSNRNALKWPRLPSSASEAIAVIRSTRSARSLRRADGQARERGHERGAVGQREPLLGLQHERLDARARPRTSAASRVWPSNATRASPSERAADVGQRDQIAARPARAALGDQRDHVVVEQLEQPLDQLDPNARVALGQAVGAQQHRHARRPRAGRSARCRSPGSAAGSAAAGRLGRRRSGGGRCRRARS